MGSPKSLGKFQEMLPNLVVEWTRVPWKHTSEALGCGMHPPYPRMRNAPQISIWLGDPKMNRIPGSTFHSNIVLGCVCVFVQIFSKYFGKSYMLHRFTGFRMVVFVVTSISASETTSFSIRNYMGKGVEHYGQISALVTTQSRFRERFHCLFSWAQLMLAQVWNIWEIIGKIWVLLGAYPNKHIHYYIIPSFAYISIQQFGR